MSDFALSLGKFAKKAGDNADLVVRKVVLDIGTSLVMRSPVGNPDTWKGPAPKGYTGGRFRANWQYGHFDPPSGTVSGVDANGSATISKLVSEVPVAASGRLHFIVNNLPYAMRLETGWSRQAPAGMVAITLREFGAMIRRAAAAAKAR